MSTNVDLISCPFSDHEFLHLANDIILYKIISLDEYGLNDF